MKTKKLISLRIKEIDHKIKHSLKGAKLLENLKKHDLRGDLFALEGVLRLHLKTESFNNKDSLVAKRVLSKIKQLEDMLGAMDLVDQMRSLDKKAKFPQNIKNQTPSKLKKLLLKMWNSSQLEKLNNQLQSLSWKKNSNSNLRKILKQELNRIQKKCKSLSIPIYKKTYDYEILEEGLHEWRRAIRWVSIYLQFYKDQIYLKESANHKKSALYKKYTNNKFAHFNGSKKDIQVDKTAYLLLSEFILDIGEVKEKGEMSLFTKRKYKNLEKDTHYLYDSFITSRVLKRLFK